MKLTVETSCICHCSSPPMLLSLLSNYPTLLVTLSFLDVDRLTVFFFILAHKTTAFEFLLLISTFFFFPHFFYIFYHLASCRCFSRYLLSSRSFIFWDTLLFVASYLISHETEIRRCTRLCKLGKRNFQKSSKTEVLLKKDICSSSIFLIGNILGYLEVSELKWWPQSSTLFKVKVTQAVVPSMLAAQRNDFYRVAEVPALHLVFYLNERSM